MNGTLFFLKYRRLVLLATFLGFFFVVFLLILWFRGDSNAPVNPANPLSQPLPQKNSQGYFVIAGTKDLKPVQVQTKDFLSEHPALNPDGDRHLLDASGYSIDYVNSFRQFFINFGVVPNDDLRRQAESDLLNILGITSSDACALDIIESVPYAFGSQYGGVNFGFSSCPSGKVIPQ